MKLSYRTRLLIHKSREILVPLKSIAETVLAVGENPTLRGYVSLGTTAASAVLTSLDTGSTFEFPEWESLDYPQALLGYLKEVCSRYPTHAFKSSSDAGYAVSTVLGQKIAFITSPGWIVVKYQTGKGISGKTVEAKIGQAIWEKEGPSVKMHTVGSVQAGFDTHFSTWKLSAGLKSDAADEMLQRVQSFWKRGISRSIMYHGPPGTGKSCMIQQIATDLHGTVLYINMAEPSATSACLLSAVELLRPDVLIIDDIDRLSSVTTTLSLLENLHKTLRLLLVSANHYGKLDAAVVRPGRFDEAIEITQLDEAALQALIGKVSLPPAAIEQIRMWPAAFIKELITVVDVLGMGYLDNELTKLQERVIHNAKGSDCRDDEVPDELP